MFSRSSRHRAALLGLAALSALTAVSPALAQFKDSDGNIHFQSGLSASQKVEYSAGELSRKITANYCGLVIVPVPKVPQCQVPSR